MWVPTGKQGHPQWQRRRYGAERCDLETLKHGLQSLLKRAAGQYAEWIRVDALRCARRAANQPKWDTGHSCLS
jgi:hypothetical protein